MKTRTKLILIYIFSFGILYLLAKHKAKKLTLNTNDKINTPRNDKFKINDLISNLGGLENIVNVEATISNLKVDLKNIDIIDQNQIKNLGAKGSFINQNKITILFGDHSQDIANKLKNKLTNM